MFAVQLGNLEQTKEIWIIKDREERPICVELWMLVYANQLTFLRLFKHLLDRILGDVF